MSKSEPIRPSMARLSSPKSSSGHHVLYMEDDLGLARLFQKRLERAGYVVDLARDGQEGLAMYEAGSYDVVAVDQKMPVYSGLEVIRAMASRGPLPPTIMITGAGSEQIAVEAMKLGAVDYVVKDVDGGYLELLPSVIEQVLHRRRLNEERQQALEALRESEARYRGLFDGVPVGLYRSTPEGQVLDANPALVEMLGYPDREALLAANAADVYVDAENRRLWRDLMERDGVARGFEVRFRRRDGAVIWVRDTARVVRDAEGRVLYYEGSVEDITERKRAEEALRTRAIQLATLNAIGRRTAVIFDQQELLQTVVNEIARELGYFRVAVLLRADDVPDELYVAAANDDFWPVIPDNYRLRVGEGLIGAAAASGETQLANQAFSDPRFYQVGKWGSPSSLSVPIKIEEETIGVLEVEDQVPDAFDQQDVDVLETAAAQLSVAIANARLYEETRQRATQLGTLYEVATTAMTSVHLDEILNRTMAALQETLRPDDIAILLVEPETNELVIRAHSGFPGGPKLVRRPIGMGIPGWVVQTGQPALLADVRGDERYHACDPDTRSELCMPLRVGERIIGALNLESRRLAAFSEEDMRLLSILAGHLATVIENAKLYEEVAGEKRKFEGAALSMAEGLVILDEDRLVAFANPQACGFLALEEDPQGRLFSEVCSHPQVVTLFQEAFDQKGIVHGEVTLDQPLPHDLDVSVASVSDEEGEPLWYVMVLHDITQLKEVDRMRSEFVSMVSHELRTPLASIMGYTEVLLSGRPGELTYTQREFLDISYESSERLLHLVDELLDASRIDAGRLRLSFELLRMERLVARLVEAIKPVAEGKGITISIEAARRLPPLEGDRNRLEQVMNNLLSNAIKFTPEGGRVTVTLARQADWVKVGVTDTGTGIPPDELPRLFQKFSRMSSATERMVEGTGLGLYITRAIVEGHGGRIWAESEPGKGSTFWFTLPLRQPRPAEVKQEELARDIAARFFDSS